MPLLSLVIPAHNEELTIENTILAYWKKFQEEMLDFEILVVNDHSSDATGEILKKMGTVVNQLKVVDSQYPGGFGFAVRTGLEHFSGQYVIIAMADLSDSPEDAVRFYRKAVEGYDCVFGSRFMRGGKAEGYPVYKYALNRLTNNFIRVAFGIYYNDTTNAFKLYSRDVIDNLKPLLSHHFNLTVELPLKSIIRGYSYAVVPNHWVNGKQRPSHLRIKEMGSRYFFVIFYCLLEKWLSRGDYKKLININAHDTTKS